MSTIIQPDDPMFITIPVPQYVKRLRGVLAVKRSLMPVRFRINPVDRKIIQRAAELLNTKEVPFYRWCALHVAREIIRRETGEVIPIDP